MITVAIFIVLLLFGFPFAFAVLITTTMGILIYSGTPLQIVIQQLYSGVNNYILLAIPFFIMSGSIAARGDTSSHLIRVMRIFFGRIHGGSLIATILACTFFAAISGSSIATIIAIGTIMIPKLVEENYPEKMAIGTVTGSGTIGILIPPSAPMIALCVALGTSVGAQFLSGVGPGLLVALSWSVYAYIASKKLELGRPLHTGFKESLIIIFKAIPALFFPLIILGGIYAGITTPTEASAISVVYVVIIELFVYKTTNMSDLYNSLSRGLVSSATLVFIMACATVLAWFVTTQQLPAKINVFITSHVNSKETFLMLILIVFIAAGFFLDTFSLIIIIAPMLKPTLLAYDIDLIHFGILCILLTQIDFTTPPFGLGLFVSMGLTKKGLWEIARAAAPYTIILTIATLLVALVPQIALWLPNILKN
ncbi:MAG: TRAP transporter large permease subunit [Deltaproteobacteria bacterium]|nr:TRAP transporter large permease subunit [Deltaproteobacteria bacterium]